MLAANDTTNENNNSADNANFTALQNEVDFYRQNQSLVEQEIKTLIADNQSLSQRVGMLLKEKLDSSRRQAMEPHKEIEEAKKQVILLTKERDSLHVLWQTSQKTIDALETEMKAYHGYGNEQTNNLESRKDLELKLESALNDYVELEGKYKESNKKNKHLENEMKSKTEEIITYKERGKELDEAIKDLERTKTDLAAETKSNEDLKSQLALSQKEIVNYVKKEAEAKSKVAEALQLFDMVIVQRDEAFKKIVESTEELSKCKQNLMNIRIEAEKQFRKEYDEVKDKYNEKVSDMLTHIQNLDTELVEKGLLLNKILRENKILQAANDNYLKQQKKSLSSVDPKLALAEERLEGMFQELVSSERRNIQLLCEKQVFALDMQRLQDTHARDTKRRDWEERLLKAEVEELRVQVEHLQKSLEETHGMINKLQSVLTSRTELNQRIVSTKEEELLALNKHLNDQMELNKRWKSSYIDMTEKLKKRFRDLQNENKELRGKLKVSPLQSLSEEANSS